MFFMQLSLSLSVIVRNVNFKLFNSTEFKGNHASSRILFVQSRQLLTSQSWVVESYVSQLGSPKSSKFCRSSLERKSIGMLVGFRFMWRLIRILHRV
jgi:hypothetical protein